MAKWKSYKSRYSAPLKVNPRGARRNTAKTFGLFYDTVMQILEEGYRVMLFVVYYSIWIYPCIIERWFTETYPLYVRAVLMYPGKIKVIYSFIVLNITT